MRIYVETNFVLELAFQQEQFVSCEKILQEAAACEAPYDLRPQDALIYASVIIHLRQHQSQGACFLNRNSKDFDSPDIVNNLNSLNCRMIPRFDHRYDFIQSQFP